MGERQGRWEGEGGGEGGMQGWDGGGGREAREVGERQGRWEGEGEGGKDAGVGWRRWERGRGGEVGR